MFMIWDSSHEGYNFFDWVSNTGHEHSFWGRFYTGCCFSAARCGAALPCGAVNWIQLISTGIFTLVGSSLAACGKLGPWVNLRRCCRRCARLGTNPPAGETVPCVKVPFRQVEAQHQMWKVSQIWQTFQIWWYRMLTKQPCGLKIAVS